MPQILEVVKKVSWAIPWAPVGEHGVCGTGGEASLILTHPQLGFTTCFTHFYLFAQKFHEFFLRKKIFKSVFAQKKKLAYSKVDKQFQSKSVEHCSR